MTTDEMTANESTPRGDLLTDCERSTYYHQERRHFYNWAHSLIQFVLLGASATGAALFFGDAFGESGKWGGIGFLTATTLLALIEVLWKPARKASDHKSLFADFTLLAGKIHSDKTPDDATVAEWTREFHAISSREPPVFYALAVQSANKVVISLGADQGYLVDLKFYHRRLRNVCHFQSTEFLSRNQLKEQAQH